MQYKKDPKSIKLGPITNIGIFSRTNLSLQYWLDRGFDEAHYKEFCKTRQGTNSIKVIAQRKNVSEEDAKIILKKRMIQKEITLNNDPNIDAINKSKGNSMNKSYWLTKINPKTDKLFTDDEIDKMFKEKYGWRRGLEYTLKDRKTNDRCIEYYTSRGHSDLDSSEMLSNRQRTFSLDICIEKFGEVEGQKRFDKRQAQWLKTLDDKSPEEKKEINRKKIERSNFYSEESIKFFDILINEINKTIPENKFRIFYKDNEYYLYKNKFYQYDFTIKELKIIIEYNGSHVHPNKQKMNEEQWNKWHNPYSKEKADSAYNKDQLKIEAAKSSGFDVIIVWDFENKNNKIRELLDIIIIIIIIEKYTKLNLK